MADNDFPEVPISTIQIGTGEIQYKTPQPVPEEFASFNSPFAPPKRYILFESKQSELEEICTTDDDIFNDSCDITDTAQHIPSDDFAPSDAFTPPEVVEGLGNFGEHVAGIEDESGYKELAPSDPTQHKFQGSKKPMHQPTGKYHIMELFWFLNPLYTKELDKIDLPQAHFCQLSYNIDFGNLKVTFYKVPNGALEGHKVYLMSCQRMTSISIYPSSLFKLIRSNEDYKNSSVMEGGPKPITVTCMEQLIFKTNEQWQQERPMAIFETNASIKLTIKDPKYGESYFIFQGWQKNALLHAADFVLNQGLLLTGQNIIAGNRVG
jgi:hypothetical protein